MNDKIKEEIYKCSKCGLCKSVCPIYLATKNEMYSPRGRYIILNNLSEQNKKPSKEFYKNLDFCLNCNLCKDFCPSNIDSAKIFTQLKYKSNIFYIKLFFIFLNNGPLNFFKKYNPKKDTTKEKILYFEGCYNNYIDCSDRNATIKILENLGYEVKVISKCCGYPFICNGDENKAKKNEAEILSIYNKEIKHIVCSCDSCYETLLKYQNEEFTSKLIRLDELLQRKNAKLNTNENILYFKPLIRKEKTYFLNEIKTINQKGICSLMENFFLIKNKKKKKEIINSMNIASLQLENKTIITTCQLSKYGLKEIIKEKNITTKVLSFSEYINLLTKNE